MSNDGKNIEDEEISEIPSVKQTKFTGIFSIFNDSGHERRQEEGHLVDLSSIPPEMAKCLTKTQFCPFLLRSKKNASLLFGPILMSSESPPFCSTISVQASIKRDILRGEQPIAFCIKDCAKPIPFWPMNFSLIIGSTMYSAPHPKYSPTSTKFWIDVSTPILENSMQLRLYAQHPVISTSFFFVISMFYPLDDKEVIALIQKKPHIETNKWLEMFRILSAGDTDVVSNSIPISIMCPLGLWKIKIPSRGCNCQHLGCFDLGAFLMYQREAGEWKCPICSKDCPLCDLIIDDVLADALEKVEGDVDSLNFKEDGSYSY